LLLLLVAAASFAQDVSCVCEEQQCEHVASERAKQTEERVTSMMESKHTDLTNAILILEKTLATKQLDVDHAQKQILQLEAGKAHETANLEATILQTANLEATILQLEAEKAQEIANLEATIQSTQDTLEQVMEREASYRTEAEELLASLKAENQVLVAHKVKASELEEHVRKLTNELQSHKTELSHTKKTLSKDVENHKAILKQAEAKFYDSRKELVLAQERMRHLHDKATSTYINTTLIYEDALFTTMKVRDRVTEVWFAAKEAAMPVYEATIKAATPVAVKVMEFYQANVAPQVSALLTKIEELYNEHAKATVENDIKPALKPVWDPIKEYSTKGYAAVSKGLQQVCDSAHFYLEQTEASGRVLSPLAFCASNGSTVINSFLWFLLILVILHFIWPTKGTNTPTNPIRRPTSANGWTKSPKKWGGHKVKSQ